jgi:hypothetical protein
MPTPNEAEIAAILNGAMNFTIDPANAHPAAPTAFAEPASAASEQQDFDEAIGTILTLDERIAAARAKLLIPADAATAEKLEAPDAELINTLLAEASEHERIAKLHTAEREKIKSFLGDLIEQAEAQVGHNIDELTVHGATVFTYKTVVSRVLDQAYLKAMFPDTPANAEAWKDQTSRRKEFK